MCCGSPQGQSLPGMPPCEALTPTSTMPHLGTLTIVNRIRLNPWADQSSVVNTNETSIGRDVIAHIMPFTFHGPHLLMGWGWGHTIDWLSRAPVSFCVGGRRGHPEMNIYLIMSTKGGPRINIIWTELPSAE